MNDNLLIRDGDEQRSAVSGQQSADPESVKTLPGHYPLDWRTQDVKLGKGRFVHTLRRPTADELLRRDAEMQSSIEIGKDGSYKLPDPTGDEELNARYYDLLSLNAQGYPGDVPASHKAAAFDAMYRREIWIDEEASVFDEEVTVLEEIGGDPPQFTVWHVFRQPSEEEMRTYRRKMQTGEIKPGKRGRQNFVTRSTLKTAMDFYDKWIVMIHGATVDGEALTDARAADAVDPLIKRMVVQEFAGKLIEALLD